MLQMFVQTVHTEDCYGTQLNSCLSVKILSWQCWMKSDTNGSWGEKISLKESVALSLAPLLTEARKSVVGWQGRPNSRHNFMIKTLPLCTCLDVTQGGKPSVASSVQPQAALPEQKQNFIQSVFLFSLTKLTRGSWSFTYFT